MKNYLYIVQWYDRSQRGISTHTTPSEPNQIKLSREKKCNPQDFRNAFSHKFIVLSFANMKEKILFLGLTQAFQKNFSKSVL